MIKAIFFDCYGTIISTGTRSVEAVKKILDSIGVSMDAGLFYTHWKNIHRDSISKQKEFKNEKEIFTDDLKILYEHYNIKSNAENDIIYMLNSLFDRSFFDDTLITINKLKDKYKIFVASNSDTEPLMQNIGNNINLFDGVFTSEDLMVYKPAKQFFEKMLNLSGYKNDEIVYVGDSLIDDIYGAKNARIYAILIDRKNEYKENDIKPDAIINDLSGLEKVIEKNLT